MPFANAVFLDLLGRHRAVCPRSGRLHTRAVPMERTLARVCREAGAFVRVNAKLRDMNVEVRADDERAIEVLALGSPSTRERSWLWTSRCVHPCARLRMVMRWSEPVPTKRRSISSSSSHLVVVGLETGGRWSTEATNFVDMLAAGRVCEVPSVLRRSTHVAWRRRWTRMLAVSCGRSEQKGRGLISLICSAISDR